MTRREKIEKVIADVKPVLEELHDEVMGEISTAQAQAEEDIRRHDEASHELEGIEARLVMLRAELDALPVEHSRAVLDDDAEEQTRLKERASEVRFEIGRLEVRASSLQGELLKLNPRSTGHPSDPTIHNLGRAASVAHSVRTDLEHLKKELTDALERAVDPVVSQHENLRATVSQLGRDRAWAMR